MAKPALIRCGGRRPTVAEENPTSCTVFLLALRTFGYIMLPLGKSAYRTLTRREVFEGLSISGARLASQSLPGNLRQGHVLSGHEEGIVRSDFLQPGTCQHQINLRPIAEGKILS